MTNSKKPKSAILFLDSNRGVYIPRDFAQVINRAYLKNVSDNTLDFLARDDSIESESYWQEWDIVLSNALITVDGIDYSLHQDGDLWLINYGMMTDKEKSNFGFDAE